MRGLLMCNPIELFASVLQEFHDDSKWNGAVLGKIKTISNTKVGSVGQRFIERLGNYPLITSTADF